MAPAHLESSVLEEQYAMQTNYVVYVHMILLLTWKHFLVFQLLSCTKHPIKEKKKARYPRTRGLQDPVGLLTAQHIGVAQSHQILMFQVRAVQAVKPVLGVLFVCVQLGSVYVQMS